MVAQCLLGTLARRLQLLKSSAVVGNVLAMLVPDQLDEVLHDPPVEILPSKERVILRAQSLIHTAHERQDARLGRAAAAVQHDDVALVAQLRP